MSDPRAAGAPWAVEDPSLDVPEPPSLARPLGSLAFPLQRAGRVEDDANFTLAGADARITGGHARGLDDARTSALRLLSGLRIDGAIAISSTLTPLGLERRLEIGGQGVVERSVVPRAGPVCFFEWTTESAGPIALTWRVPPHLGLDGTAVGGLRWRATDRGLLVAAGAARALFVLSRAPIAVSVADAADAADAADVAGGGVEVRVQVEPGERSFRLGVAGIAAGADQERILRVMGRGHIVAPTRRAAAQRVVDGGLRVEAPDALLGEALAWSKLRLASRAPVMAAGGGALGERDARLILAALATGDPAPARALLAAPLAPPAAHPEARRQADPAAAARHLLVTARYLAWTGDLRTVTAAREALRAGVDTCLEALTAAKARAGGLPGAGTSPAEEEVISGALRELVVVAEETGDAALAERIRVAVGARPGEEATPRSPMAPGPQAAGPQAAGDAALCSATLIEAVVHGLLGVEPDAPRGRLVLRPRLPRSWATLTVRNLRMGSAAVELAYDRVGARHAFTLRQERGAAPVRVILEPEIEGLRVVAARVDGEPAGLDPVAAEGRLRVPVQLVLDHERRLEVEIEGADA